MNNNITLDHRNSKMIFPLHLTSKSSIFAMLHSFSWLVLYAVLTKMALINKNTYTDKPRNISRS